MSRPYQVLRVLIDENLTWKNQINFIGNKISKSLGIAHRATFLLNQESWKKFYISFIHIYINYGNIAWDSTHKTKLKKIFS